MSKKTKSTVVDFRRDRESYQRIVRDALDDNSKLFWIGHVKKRLKERNISITQVLACLDKGKVIEGPIQDSKGYWRCTYSRLVSGQELNVVTSIVQIKPGVEVIIITVFAK